MKKAKLRKIKRAADRMMGAAVVILLGVSVTCESLIDLRHGWAIMLGLSAAAYLLIRSAEWIHAELHRKRLAKFDSMAWRLDY